MAPSMMARASASVSCGEGYASGVVAGACATAGGDAIYFSERVFVKDGLLDRFAVGPVSEHRRAALRKIGRR